MARKAARFALRSAASGTAHDGIRNGGEGGLNGIKVSARHASCAGGLCAEAMTDSDGRFQFLLARKFERQHLRAFHEGARQGVAKPRITQQNPR